MRRRLSGLGFRLMAVMGVALLPLAALSYVQGSQSARLSESRITSAILGRTLVAATPLMGELVKAQGKAATLAASLPSVLRAESFGDSGVCDELMDNVVSASIGMVRFAGFVRRDGIMDCASGEESRDFSQSPVLAEILADPKPRITVNPYGPVTRTSVLIFTHPVYDSRNALVGVVLLSMPHSVLGSRTPLSGDAQQPLTLVTFSGDGSVLTSSTGMERVADNLPSDRALKDLGATAGESFVATTALGQRRAFAVVPLQAGTLYLLGSWPANRLDDTVLEGAFPAFLFPMLMWAASLLVAWLASESQVLRHIRSLRDSITAFADGQRQLPPLALRGAALELQSVGRAYEAMTESVVRNEADLENTIHQKEVLLREVHHRVKNNLQLIASILNMQLRGARSAEAKDAMRTLQDRVISLATVHRELYQTSGLADVRADELLPRVARDLLHIGSTPQRRFELKAEVEDIHLTPDQAVPLALFLTEGMANVIKHSRSDGSQRLQVGLRLVRTDQGQAKLTLCNSLDSDAEPGLPDWVAGSDGFGSQLLVAFSQQLNGRITRGRQGDGYVLALDFPLRPLIDGEERRSAAPAGPDTEPKA